MDSLQFQKLEVADTRPKCVACKSPIATSYYQFGGQTICPTCAGIARSSQARPGNAAVMRGFLYGLGATVACSIGYAVITMATNMEFALIAILVGFLVGRAVRIGSRGLGGRRCQILAVALTNLAITTSYVPLMIKELRAQQTDAAKTSPAPESRPKATIVGYTVAMAVVVALSIASPFFGLAGGVSGIINVVIIFVGLAQAWKQTRRDERLLMGPYELSEGQAVG